MVSGMFELSTSWNTGPRDGCVSFLIFMLPFLVSQLNHSCSHIECLHLHLPLSPPMFFSRVQIVVIVLRVSMTSLFPHIHTSTRVIQLFRTLHQPFRIILSPLPRTHDSFQRSSFAPPRLFYVARDLDQTICPHNPPNCQYNSNHTPVFNMPVALPCNPFLVGTTPHKAYDICLRFERRVLSLRQPSPQLVCARILGYMLIHAPVVTGRDYLAQEIIDCADDDTLGKLGKFYDNNLIRLCEYLLRLLYS
jgi:hypothetical protein